MATARGKLRPRTSWEAVAVLRPLERGWFLETTNLHITLTEVHERSAEAWGLAGVTDSAAAEWRQVARDWERADPRLQPRRLHAAARLAALTPRP